MERSNYALISALYADKTRGLYSDIYFPIIKYAIVKIYADRSSLEAYTEVETVHDKIVELFDIKIPHVVIAKTVMKLATAQEDSIELEAYEEGRVFKIKSAYFDEEESTYQEREQRFNIHLMEIEQEYAGFLSRQGSCDDNASFTEFISKNTENILGYFENGREEQVEEKYTSMVFFLEHLNHNEHELFKVANQLFWSSVLVAFLQSERPEVYDQERGCESEYFIDTSIAMGILELSTPENEASAKDVQDIITSAGGRLRIHPATLEEIKTILSSVAQNGAYPGTSIANACTRRNLSANDILKIQLNLNRVIDSKGIEVFPPASAEIRREVISKYKNKDVLRRLGESRMFTIGESSHYTSSDQYREAHDLYLDDYIRDLRNRRDKKNVYFLTTNTDLISFCRERHPDENFMISTSKVILDLWMHNAKPAQVSTSMLTETMARCLDMHRSKVRKKLNDVARFFNKNKEDVPPEVYQELLKFLYRRARKVVNVVDTVPADNPKAYLETLQEAIKEDTAYFDAQNSAIHSRNNTLQEEVERQTEKVLSLTEESERKTEEIGSLNARNETLTEEKGQLIEDLKATRVELKEEKGLYEEEVKARQLAQFKNRIFEKRLTLESKRDELEEQLKPLIKSRHDSFKSREMTILVLSMFSILIPYSIVTTYLAETRGVAYLYHNVWYYVSGVLVFGVIILLVNWILSEKRMKERRQKAYAKWEKKPENADYLRLTKEIEVLDEEIAKCKTMLKNPTSYMDDMKN